MIDDQLRKAILTTLAYRNVFGYPLTFYQIYTYLLAPEPLDFGEFKRNLVELLEDKSVKYDSNFFHLGDVKVAERIRREEESKTLFDEACKVTGRLGVIPFVKLVCVTGAVAAGNADTNGDIDILIVTSAGRLWLTRFLVVTLLKLFRVYRTDKHEGGKICPNIFIDESDLSWNINRNEYIAHEVLLMKPALDKGDYYFKFLGSNLWVNNFLPHHNLSHITDIPESRPGEKEKRGLKDFLEKILMKVQLWYMRNKKTNEITTQRLIHFRRDDHTNRILNSFKENLQKLKL
ncbi:hypothetical protein HY419_00330 [candidate division WWE3 bacterium]|nr:hypothetical protein [candidate division WWE3 bacterium]